MVPTASGLIWRNQTSTASAMRFSSSVMPAIIAGLRKRASGTSTSHPATAPLKRIAEMRRPTMKPTPMTIGDASGVDSRIPPEYSKRRPAISIADFPKWTKRLAESWMIWIPAEFLISSHSAAMPMEAKTRPAPV